MLEIATDEQTAAPMNWEQTDLYRFLARLFAPPTRECFEFLAQPSVTKDLRDLGHYLACDEEVPEFNWFPTYDSYEAAYISLFDVGLPEPIVPLFESAHDKSHPAQEIALENTYFFEVLGLRSDPTIGVPDYLITQLEFLAAVSFTADNTLDETTRASLARAKSEFLERHLLNWLPSVATKLYKSGAPGFPFLMRLLVQFLRKEHSEVRLRLSA
jgi:DMSO reductase family type II enzyme chaperone